MSLVEFIANLTIDPWVDLRAHQPLTQIDLTRVGMLPGCTVSGRAGVVLVFEHNGKPLIAQIPWTTWQVIAAALAATPVAQMEDL